MNAPELTEYDAMIMVLVAVEGFLSLPWDEMSRDTKRGAALLFDQLLQRAKPLLRQTPEMAHVFAGIAQAERLADAIRQVEGAPRRI